MVVYLICRLSAVLISNNGRSRRPAPTCKKLFRSSNVSKNSHPPSQTCGDAKFRDGGGGGLFEPRLGVNAPIYPSLLCTGFQQMDKRDRGDRCISGA